MHLLTPRICIFSPFYPITENKTKTDYQCILLFQVLVEKEERAKRDNGRERREVKIKQNGRRLGEDHMKDQMGR